MPVRSFFRAPLLVSGLAAAAGLLGACGKDVDSAYTGPGWYLELPRLVFMTTPGYVAGPFSYEECEVERLKHQNAERLLCTQRRAKPSES
ncbi:MAG: hypothetical protein JSR24_20135 [Proteobacteria bacterium]|nr:hypothetical protein [Pseudomonadota bacterium]